MADSVFGEIGSGLTLSTNQGVRRNAANDAFEAFTVPAGIATPVSAANGGTGVANGAGCTLTMDNAAFALSGGGASCDLVLPDASTTITGGGTLALGTFTFTVPATGSAALLGVNNAFTVGMSVVGSTDITQVSITGFTTQANPPLTVTRNDGATNAPGVALKLSQNSTGAPAAGLGVQIDFAAEDSTTVSEVIASIAATFTNVTHATFASSLAFSAVDFAATRKVLEIGANGSAPTLALFGAALSVQSTGWSVSNCSSDKSFDGHASTLNEALDVLGTLITEMLTKGLIGA